MDTKLKKGKKIRSFLYRIVAAGAMLAVIGTGLLGREPLRNLYQEGFGTFSGNIYYMTEFREYIAYLYNQGMIGYAGVGDDNGYPLTDSAAKERAEESKKAFSNEVNLNRNELLYYIKNNGRIVATNIPSPLFSEYDGHLLLPEDATLCCYWDGSTGRLNFFSDTHSVPNPSVLKKYYEPQYQPNKDNTEDIKLILAVKSDLSYRLGQVGHLNSLVYQARRSSNLLNAFVISLTILILALIGCLFTIRAGKQAKKDYLCIISKLWLELRILIISGMLLLCFSLKLWHFGASLNYRLTSSCNWGLYFPMGILLYLLYIDINGHGFDIFKQTLIYRLYCSIRNYQHSLPWRKKALNLYYFMLSTTVLLFIIGIYCLVPELISRHFLYYPLRLMIPIGILLPALLLLPASLRLKRFIDDTEAFTDKLAAVTDGKTTPPLVFPDSSLLAEAAHNLNEVSNGIETAITQINRSNKMRVELITNVSHDLKTPLTAIINYADLLCEEDLPENAAAYAQSLRDKSYRLKSMVQDVFDLSKATSGNLNVEKTRLDLAKLIRQTLADMDERISESTLSFKLGIADEPLFVEADGEKLYRVFQNLIINALQYSLDHSRVHILLEKRNGSALVMIKNTSRQELNFTAEEILERFVRADASRTTEGSGLGLSIVQSFTEACGGTFTIEMDADLFTACVSFPSISDIS